MDGVPRREWGPELSRMEGKLREKFRAEHGGLAMGSAPTLTFDQVTMRKAHTHIYMKCTQIIHRGADACTKRSLPRYRKENYRVLEQ